MNIFFSQNGTARLPSGIYIGDPDGHALKITKGYIGDEDGVARQIYPFEPPSPPEPPTPTTGYLIQNGVSVNESISGGWVAIEGASDYDDPREPDITQNAGYITISQPKNTSGQDIGYHGFYVTKNSIDLSGYSKLHMDGYASYSMRGHGGSLVRMKPLGIGFESAVSIDKTARQTFTMDLTNISNSRKIGIRAYGFGKRYSRVLEIYVYNLWLEA